MESAAAGDVFGSPASAALDGAPLGAADFHRRDPVRPAADAGTGLAASIGGERNDAPASVDCHEHVATGAREVVRLFSNARAG